MMENSSDQRPHLPGPFPSISADSFREGYLQPAGEHAPIDPNDTHEQVPTDPNNTLQMSNTQAGNNDRTTTPSTRRSSDPTAVPSPAGSHVDTEAGAAVAPKPSHSPTDKEIGPRESMDEGERANDVGQFEPIKAADKETRPALVSKNSGRMTEDDLFRAISRRRSNTTGRQGSVATSADDHEEQAEIERLMSRIFGQNRQAQSEDEKTRHVGVVFKNLTVKGVGLGAALQPTLGDFFLKLPRFIGGLFSNPSRATGKPPIRTLVNGFSGCIRPGEMLLVLGRPGSGCSTFLKVVANQRFGYKSVEGEVTYGGTSAKEMGKEYASEVVYNPEDDLHYATLSVKNTLKFALETRTPGKASRNEGESRKDYVKEFLRVVAKLFWIEHTMNTKVGDAFIRGVSGGEKKRVSIAEAMITKASIQCWDNSTRGLDASTALEYVQSLRSLTNMAHISTSVALYQAGESLYGLFDKVLLIDEGKCLYYGPTENAAAYFENLGFSRPPRWTTADFLTSVTDQHERQIREGYEDRFPRSAEQFEEVYAKSDVSAANLRDIEEFEQHTEEQRRQRQAATTKATKKKNYTLPFYKQVLVCTHRQFLIMFGDRLSLGGKWG
jgi:ATP-binding cassette subfamily G (WHITE) protein 2 (SNQ2)